MIYFGYTKQRGNIMTATLSNWGNSQGLRFPKDIMREMSLSVGDKLKIFVENQKRILEPIKNERVKYNIDDLVKKIPQDYKAYEELDNKIGNEQW
jgi:antitoxin MazE